MVEQLINLKDLLTDSFKVKKGDYLFEEGDAEKFVYYISDGSVNIFRKKSILWSAGDSEFIGISSFFSDGSEYRFSAKAAMDSVVYRISEADFTNLLTKNPGFSRMIMDLLCNRIRLTNTRTKTLLKSSSRCRLIKEIVRKVNESDSKDIDYSLDELSEIVGVSKRLIRNLLSDLEKKKLLERIKSRLIIHDLQGLEIIASKN